jgi:hypothetical protein
MPKITREARSILGDALSDVVSDAFDQMTWAEEEIEQAQRCHPERSATIYHAFELLVPSPVLQQVGPAEFVHRSHYRELLERVADGEDTRPATDAEIACACSEASRAVPLNTTATGLYIRVWRRAFPDQRNAFTKLDDAGHYEAIAGSDIDDLEADICRKLTVKDRTLNGRACSGRHHGEPVPDCPYYAQAKAA